MKRLNSATVFMVALLLLIGALAITSISFLNQMNSNYILIQRSNQPSKLVLNHFKYVQNKKGFIFSLTFLVAATSILIMIALPATEARIQAKPKTKPQPMRPDREESSISAVIEQAKEKPKPKTAPEPVSTIATVDKEEAGIEPPVEIVETIEEISTDIEDITEGEDDVVYGSGPISDAAIMHFVHKFPDSALKFLFRKQLDGKALTNVEESIYQEWENRNLTRGKVKGYILTLMDWKEFPKKPLYETWREIRDHIFENVD